MTHHAQGFRLVVPHLLADMGELGVCALRGALSLRRVVLCDLQSLQSMYLEWSAQICPQQNLLVTTVACVAYSGAVAQFWGSHSLRHAWHVYCALNIPQHLLSNAWEQACAALLLPGTKTTHQKADVESFQTSILVPANVQVVRDRWRSVACPATLNTHIKQAWCCRWRHLWAGQGTPEPLAPCKAVTHHLQGSLAQLLLLHLRAQVSDLAVRVLRAALSCGRLVLRGLHSLQSVFEPFEPGYMPTSTCSSHLALVFAQLALARQQGRGPHR